MRDCVPLLGLLSIGACSAESTAPEARALEADAAAKAVSEPAPHDGAVPAPTESARADDAGSDAAVTLDVPASLVSALGGKTYVEESCVPTTYPGWPHPAQKCTYRNGLVVTIANPPPDRVARWIVDASKLITALADLATKDRPSWEAGLALMAKHTIRQSSRIFPLAGQVWENGTAYTFERGVTKTCSSGCYCRVNSMSRQNWCAYAAQVLGTEVESSCLSKFGQPQKTLTDAWLGHCLANHVAAWNTDHNMHYRAHAWRANQNVTAKLGATPAPTSSAVLDALALEYP